MAAFVVVEPSAPSSVPLTGTRLGIFPGAASPSVFRAGAAFWIGYGFVPEPVANEGTRALEPDTRFELAVDGEFVELVTELESSNGTHRAAAERRDLSEWASGRLALLPGTLVRRGQARPLQRPIDRVRRVMGASVGEPPGSPTPPPLVRCADKSLCDLSVS